MATFATRVSTALVATLCTYSTFAAAPAPEQIFDNHIKAIGGEAAIRAIKTRYFDGTMENKRNKSISRMTAWQKAPNLSYAEVETLGQGTYAQGYDGKEAWAQDANGVVKTLTGSEAASVIDSALMYGDLEWKTRYTEVKTIGETTFEGKAAVEVGCKTLAGTDRSIYFDPTTWMQIGVREAVMGPPGPDGKPQKQYLVTLFQDYRDVAGVKTAAKFVQKLGEFEVISAFNTVEANTELKVSFEKPVSATLPEPAPAPAESTSAATNSSKK